MVASLYKILILPSAMVLIHKPKLLNVRVKATSYAMSVTNQKESAQGNCWEF